MAKKKKESPAAKSQRAITTFFPASPVKNKSGPQKSTTGNAERKKKPAKDPEFPLQKTKVKKVSFIVDFDIVVAEFFFHTELLADKPLSLSFLLRTLKRTITRTVFLSLERWWTMMTTRTPTRSS